MQIHSLPAGGTFGAAEIEVSRRRQYTKQSSAHKRCFISDITGKINENDIENFQKTVGFLQRYSDINHLRRILILNRAVLMFIHV